MRRRGCGARRGSVRARVGSHPSAGRRRSSCPIPSRDRLAPNVAFRPDAVASEHGSELRSGPDEARDFGDVGRRLHLDARGVDRHAPLVADHVPVQLVVIAGTAAAHPRPCSRSCTCADPVIVRSGSPMRMRRKAPSSESCTASGVPSLAETLSDIDLVAAVVVVVVSLAADEVALDPVARVRYRSRRRSSPAPAACRRAGSRCRRHNS